MYAFPGVVLSLVVAGGGSFPLQCLHGVLETLWPDAAVARYSGGGGYLLSG